MEFFFFLHRFIPFFILGGGWNFGFFFFTLVGEVGKLTGEGERKMGIQS